jgi:hypothetical protein
MRDARSRGCTLRPTRRHRTSARGLVSESRRSTALCSDKGYLCADGLRPRRRQSVSYHKPRRRVGGVRPIVAEEQHRNRNPQQRPLPAEHLFLRREHPQPDPLPLNQAAPDNGSGFTSWASVWSRPRTSETPCVRRSPWERHRLRLSSERVDKPRLELGQTSRRWAVAYSSASLRARQREPIQIVPLVAGRTVTSKPPQAALGWKPARLRPTCPNHGWMAAATATVRGRCTATPSLLRVCCRPGRV